MESVHGKFEMEKFDGSGDFGMWKFKMQMQLELQGLGHILTEADSSTKVEATYDSDDITDKEVKKDPLAKEKDTRARNLICSSLTNMVLRKVMRATTAMGVWKAFEADYQTKTLPNRIYLKQSFASYRMLESKSIEENLDVFLKLVDDLASLNIQVSDEDQAIQILTSLPPQCDSLVHTLKYGNGKETLTIKEVTTSAYAKEAELKEKGLLKRSKSDAEGLVLLEEEVTRDKENVGGLDIKAKISDQSLKAKVNRRLGSVGSVVKKDILKENVLREKIRDLRMRQMWPKTESIL